MCLCDSAEGFESPSIISQKKKKKKKKKPDDVFFFFFSFFFFGIPCPYKKPARRYFFAIRCSYRNSELPEQCLHLCKTGLRCLPKQYIILKKVRIFAVIFLNTCITYLTHYHTYFILISTGQPRDSCSFSYFYVKTYVLFF